MGSAHPWRLREGRSRLLTDWGDPRVTSPPRQEGDGRDGGHTRESGFKSSAAALPAETTGGTGHPRRHPGRDFGDGGGDVSPSRAVLAPCPPPSAPDPTGGDGTGCGPSPSEIGPRYLPRAQPHDGHPGAGVELHAGRHGSSRECCPVVPPAEPFNDGGAVPTPCRDPPARESHGPAGTALLLPEPPQLLCGLRHPSEGGMMLAVTGEEERPPS